MTSAISIKKKKQKHDDNNNKKTKQDNPNSLQTHPALRKKERKKGKKNSLTP